MTYPSGMNVGTIQLAGFEIPNCIYFGGSQRMAVHRLAGGAQAVELLGPDEDDIRFRGVFSGPNAETRARSFDALRMDGATVPLSWESFRYDVILRSFRASFVNPWWIPYTVGLLVVRRQVDPVSSTGNQPGSLQSDILAVTALAPEIGISLSALSDGQLLQDAATIGSDANLKVSALLSEAIASVNALISEAGSALGSAPGSSILRQAPGSAMSAQTRAAELLSIDLTVRSLLSRALSSLRTGATA
jgi:hypothetical protein